MNAIETQPSGSSPASRPQFTAALLLRQRAAVSFAQLRSELKRIAPDAELGNWSGPVTNPAADPGVEMLSLNGERLSVLVVDGPAPASMLQAGPFPNLLWPNAEKEAAEHRVHILVVAPEGPPDREAALAKARAVTLLAGALARIVPAIGVTWIDSANLVKYLLRSGKRLGDGESIGVDGQAGFAIAHAEKGNFGSFPVARLNLLPKT